MTTMVRRAGDCNGLPDWQLDLMLQNERETAWEKLNAEDSCKDEMVRASESLRKAIKELDDGLDLILSAEDDLYQTPMADKVATYRRRLDYLMMEIKETADHFRKGERE